MPAIRDQSIAYAAAATSITVPMCDYAQNDLLVAFVINDQASTYTTPSGWSVVPNFPSVNTVQSNSYYKIAGASEGDFSITGTTSDTQCACVIAIRDIDTSNPFGNAAVTSVTTHTATSRFACPSITTNRADSLILYFASAGGSSTSAPPLGVAVLEGKVNELNIIDGTGEGMGVGWSFQRATGATPSDIYVVNPAFATYGVGSVATLQIAAPSGGATVIPPYLAADTSQFLEHGSGTAAFDGNTGMAATADTAGFGTSITVNGSARTIGDATVAAVADVGINSFHSLSGLTNAASAYMSGAQVLLGSTRYNLGDSNILAHLRASTPANNQRLSPVVGYRGCWMGLRSGTTASTNYKIWQVHGADAPFAPGSVVPVIVNPANADYIASAGTLSNSDVRNVGFWVGGLGALTAQVGVGMVWKMGTTTVAGGNAAEPVGIDGIVRVAADGKERLSSIRQGANQMLCLQALQFGDGGTNAIYLKLDSTAIEFPKRRTVAQKTVYYNGTDDSVGLTYYAGASDTIKHISSVISSANKYHWRIHASSSASASYDFSGLSIIGAGDVQLRAVTTFTGMSFTNCPTITQNSAVLSGCAFKDSKVISAALGDLDNLSDCTFTSSGTGHALEVGGSASTITFSGNTFTGYAASNGSTGNEAIYVNIASGTVTLNISGGSTPSIRTAGATVVVNNSVTLTLTGLVSGSDIVIRTHGTTTMRAQVDAHGSTSYGFTYSYAASDYVDIEVYQPGYIPWSSWNYLLSSSNASLPVAQVADPSYVS